MRIIDKAELQLPERFLIKLNNDIEYLLSYEALEIEEIVLFGSCARGDYKVTSDLDLLLITKEPTSRLIRGDIASMLDEPLEGVRTDIVFYSREVFNTSNSLIIQKIRQEGLIIYRCKA